MKKENRKMNTRAAGKSKNDDNASGREEDSDTPPNTDNGDKTTNTSNAGTGADATAGLGDDLHNLVPGLEEAKSFESNFSLGGMSMGSHGISGIGGMGMSVSLQHDAELMLSLSKSNSHDDDDNSLSDVLKFNLSAKRDDDVSRAADRDDDNTGRDGPPAPSPVDLIMAAAAAAADHPTTTVPPAEGAKEGSGDGMSVASSSAGSAPPSTFPNTAQMNSPRRPPPPPNNATTRSPQLNPYPPPPGSHPQSRPLPGHAPYPTYGHPSQYQRYGPGPPGSYRPGPPPPPPPPGHYPPPHKLAAGQKPSGGNNNGGRPNPGPYPHGPPPPPPGYRVPPGPGSHHLPPPPHGPHGPPPPPHYGHHHRHPYGHGHRHPPHPHHPHAYPPHHAYGLRPPPPPQGAGSASTASPAGNNDDGKSTANSSSESSIASGGSNTAPVAESSSVASQEVSATPSKDRSTVTASSAVAKSEGTNSVKGENKSVESNGEERKVGEASPSTTIVTVGSTVSTGSQGTMSTTGSIRKKRTFDALSTTESSGSAFTKASNPADSGASVGSTGSSVMSSPHRMHPHHQHHPPHHGYGYGHGHPYPHHHGGHHYPNHHHSGRGRHPVSYPHPPHMPPRYASPYHASPTTRRPQEGHTPGSATAPQQPASLSSSGAGAPTSSHPLGMFTDEQMRHHRRSNSGSSTTSSLSSVGGVSLGSIVGREGNENEDDASVLGGSQKRRKQQEPPAYMMSPGASSVGSLTRNRLGNLTVKDEKDMAMTEEGSQKNSAPTIELPASPINGLADTAKTPISKNTRGSSKNTDKKEEGTFDFDTDVRSAADKATTGREDGKEKETRNNIFSAFRKKSSAAADAVNTPSLYSKRTDSLSFDFGDMIKDDPLLNSQLRGQSFTPLPHVDSGLRGIDTSGKTPSMNPSLSSLGPQLSWSISPHIGDIAEWADADFKTSKSEGPIQPSLSSDGAKEGENKGSKEEHSNISPVALGAPSLSFWHDDEIAAAIGGGSASKDDTLLRLSNLSPENIDTSMNMTPMPVFFDQSMPPPQSGSNEERENLSKGQQNGQTPYQKYKGQPGSVYGSSQKPQQLGRFLPLTSSASWAVESPHHPGMLPIDRRGPMNSQEVGGSHQRRDGPPQVLPSPRHIYVSPPGGYGSQGDRVRNLRGRAPHGAPSLHIPPHLCSSYHPHNLTSPMVGGMHNPGMWGSPHGLHPHHGIRSPHHMGSPHHIRPLELTPSKRKCVPLKPPIPSKFQGDIDKCKTAQVPEFTSLVNFPVHISQKQSASLPDGMRCCVMCGQACQSNGSGKASKRAPANKAGAKDKNAALGASGNYAVIPTQNKGLCTSCDVNVWIVVQSNLQIKWCKGCKNFRPWASFGDKGLATKCVRCRERQREKYALQKEEKERSKAASRR